MRVVLLILGVLAFGCSERDVAELLVEPVRETRRATGATYRAIEVVQSAHAVARHQRLRPDDRCSRESPTTNSVSVELIRSLGSEKIWTYRESRMYRRAADGSVELVITSQPTAGSDRRGKTHAFRASRSGSWIRDPDASDWYRNDEVSPDQLKSMGIESLQVFLNSGAGWRRLGDHWVLGTEDLQCEFVANPRGDEKWLTRFKARVEHVDARFVHNSAERRRQISLVWSLSSGETLTLEAFEEWTYDPVPMIASPTNENRVEVLRDRTAIQVQTTLQRFIDAGLVAEGEQ